MFIICLCAVFEIKFKKKRTQNENKNMKNERKKCTHTADQVEKNGHVRNM